jgi:hypothetical protein
MLKQAAIFLTALSVLIGIFLLVERTSSPFFQKCISEESSDEGKQSSKEGYGRIGSVIFVNVRCSGRFMDGHGVGLTAVASFIIAAFTATLWVATKQQGRLTFESLKLAREEFAAIHRPEIVVHAIEVRHNETAKGDSLGASILCFNKGRTAAERVEVRAEILVTHKLEIDIQRRLIKEVPSVVSGQKMRIEMLSDRLVKELQAFVRTRRDMIAVGNPPDVYCVGTISYFDQNKTRRETAFCCIWTLDPFGERWDSAKSPEHEYAY